MSYLRLENVSKSYGDAVAVREVSLDVPKGAFLTLLGPSGSGKTTVLMMLAGFVRPDAGRILLDGQDLTAAGPSERGLGVVFQGYALFPHMSVFDNVAFPLRVRRLEKGEIARRVADMLALVQLTGFERRLPRELSGGQQQRVAFARALSFDPPILLLDEPLSALDRMLRQQLQSEIKALHRRVGKTFVYVTHDQGEALALSTHIAVMNGGKVEQFTTPAALYRQPRTRFIADFVGGSNILAVSGVSSGTDGAVGTVDGTRVRLPAKEACRAGTMHGTVALRFEKIRLSSSCADAENAIEVTVADADFHGDHYLVELRTTAGQMVKARVAAEAVEGGLLRENRLYACWRASDATWVPEDS